MPTNVTDPYASLPTLLLLSSSSLAQLSDDYGSCGGCHCISDSVGGECPVPIPATNFSAILPTARTLAYSNPMSLSCDPYSDAGCNTEPSLEDGEVCAMSLFLNSPDTCPAATNYLLETTWEQDAIDHNLVITHYGACGVCSSQQDLALYMKFPDLTEQGIKCATLALMAGFDLGVKCWTDFGMSFNCANIWIHNSSNTAANCVA